MKICAFGVVLSLIAFLPSAVRSQLSASDIPTPPSSCADAYCNCNGRQVEVGCANQNADCRCICGYSSCPQKSAGAESGSGTVARDAGNAAMMGSVAHGLGGMLGAALAPAPPPLPSYTPPKVVIPQNIDDNPAADASINSGVGAAQDIINGYADSTPAAEKPSGEEGGVPALLRGDPMKDCQGKNLIYNPECADISLDTPALRANTAENQKALADGAAFQSDIDADAQAQEDADSMQDMITDYLKDKTTDNLEDIGKELGLPVDAIKRVEEGGGTLKNYATNTLNNFDGESSNAACALGAGSAACMDGYHDAEANQQGSTKKLDQDTYKFVGEQFNVKPAEGGEDSGGSNDSGGNNFFSIFK